MRVRSALLLVCLSGLVHSAPAQGQTPRESRGDIAVSVAALDFDLSGTGQTAGVAVRATRDVTPHITFEARGLFAKPEQQFGTSTIVVPEAYLLYRWPIARWTPFIGAGTGAAAIRSDLGTDWDATLSVAGGTGFRLTERLGLLGEMRVRGVEWRFVGSIAEWALGLTWRIP